MSIKLENEISRCALPGPMKRILKAMARYAGDTGGECFPTLETLARDTGLSRAAVARHRQRALGLGILERTGGEKGGRNVGASYQFHLEGLRRLEPRAQTRLPFPSGDRSQNETGQPPEGSQNETGQPPEGSQNETPRPVSPVSKRDPNSQSQSHDQSQSLSQNRPQQNLSDLTLTSLLGIKWKLVKPTEVRGFRELERDWLHQGSPQDPNQLAQVIDNFLKKTVSNGTRYPSFLLRKLKELQRQRGNGQPSARPAIAPEPPAGERQPCALCHGRGFTGGTINVETGEIAPGLPQLCRHCLGRGYRG